jgi:hypothetical protein
VVSSSSSVSFSLSRIIFVLKPACGVIKKDGEENIYYAIFHDGQQTVLLFASDVSVIESVTDV